MKRWGHEWEGGWGEGNGRIRTYMYDLNKEILKSVINYNNNNREQQHRGCCSHNAVPSHKGQWGAGEGEKEHMQYFNNKEFFKNQKQKRTEGVCLPWHACVAKSPACCWDAMCTCDIFTSFLLSDPIFRATESHHQPQEGEEQRGQPGGLVLQRDRKWGPGALLVPQRWNPQPWEKCEDHRDQPRKPYHGSHGQKWRGRVPVLCARGQAVRSRLCAGGPWRSVGLGTGSAAKSPAPEHSQGRTRGGPVLLAPSLHFLYLSDLYSHLYLSIYPTSW